jgi:sec-independent protein translocase protein TatC
MLALALPMTALFLAAEAVSHIHDRRAARRLALAGDSVNHSIEGDLALRELSERDEPDART